jgi:hypothetical protein
VHSWAEGLTLSGSLQCSLLPTQLADESTAGLIHAPDASEPFDAVDSGRNPSFFTKDTSETNAHTARPSASLPDEVLDRLRFLYLRAKRI